MQAAAQGDSASDDEAEPEDESQKTHEDDSKAAPANKPPVPALKTKAKPIATKKKSAPPLPQKAKPIVGKPASGSSGWMQDHL